MSILKKISDHKRIEVQLKKTLVSTEDLIRMPLYNRETYSLTSNLESSATGIIAEFKRRSPSRDVINNRSKVNEVAIGYTEAGASGLSVLTDGTFFGGSLDDLLLARSCTSLPILRKDFIIDEYQIHEAKAYGADVILLIAAILDRKEIELFSELAHSLQLQVLAEVHDETELNLIRDINLDLIGVNNRNLKTFEVSLETSKALSKRIPETAVPITESGIGSPKAIRDLKKYGYRGFLIGESFMKTDNPGAELKTFINELSNEN